jgi:hypothetical protein
MSGRSFDVFSHSATAMDFSPDGERLLILSYGDVFELDFQAFLAGQLRHQTIAVNRSLQQEGISYLPSKEGFVFTAEARSGRSPIKEVICLTN